MVKVNLGEKQYCLRCWHSWLPRQEEVIICPKCKNPYWNKKKGDTHESKKDDTT